MRRVVVRYRTKPEASEENQRLVENVFEELDERRPDGLRYATLRLADGVTFVHVAVIETDDGSNPLGESEAFAEFQRAIEDRCTEPPAPQDATLIGSYRLFAD
jgi:hypothetical protein